MYLGGRFDGETVVKLATTPPPYGPGLKAEDCEGADFIEIHHSSFKDPGKDFDEWRLTTAEGKILKAVQMTGY